MSSATTQFRLYVAGQAPNSRMAVENLNALCQRYLPGAHSIELVDVLAEPQRALDDRVLMTPLLVILSVSPIQKIIGNLSQATIVLNALGLAGEPV